MDPRKLGKTSSDVLLTAVPIIELEKNLAWQHVYSREMDEKRKFDHVLMGRRDDIRSYVGLFHYIKKNPQRYSLEVEKKEGGRWTIFNPNHIQPGYFQNNNITNQEKWEQCNNWNKGYWAAAIHLRKEFWLVSDMDTVMYRVTRNDAAFLQQRGPGSTFYELLWLMDNQYQFEKIQDGFTNKTIIIARPTLDIFDDTPPLIYNYTLNEFEIGVRRLKALYRKLEGLEWSLEDAKENPYLLSKFKRQNRSFLIVDRSDEDIQNLILKHHDGQRPGIVKTKEEAFQTSSVLPESQISPISSESEESPKATIASEQVLSDAQDKQSSDDQASSDAEDEQFFDDQVSSGTEDKQYSDNPAAAKKTYAEIVHNAKVQEKSAVTHNNRKASLQKNSGSQKSISSLFKKEAKETSKSKRDDSKHISIIQEILNPKIKQKKLSFSELVSLTSFQDIAFDGEQDSDGAIEATLSNSDEIQASKRSLISKKVLRKKEMKKENPLLEPAFKSLIKYTLENYIKTNSIERDIEEIKSIKKDLLEFFKKTEFYCYPISDKQRNNVSERIKASLSYIQKRQCRFLIWPGTIHLLRFDSSQLGFEPAKRNRL